MAAFATAIPPQPLMERADPAFPQGGGDSSGAMIPPMSSATSDPPAFNEAEFVQAKLGEVANGLKEAAIVLQARMPHLLPYLETMLKAGAELVKGLPQPENTQPQGINPDSALPVEPHSVPIG